MHDGQQAMELLVAAFPEGAASSIDPPKDREKGVWHLDVTIDEQLEIVSWIPGTGYGLYDMPEPTFGQHPNIVIQDPKEAVSRMLDLMAKARSVSRPEA